MGRLWSEKKEAGGKHSLLDVLERRAILTDQEENRRKLFLQLFEIQLESFGGRSPRPQTGKDNQEDDDDKDNESDLFAGENDSCAGFGSGV